MIATIDTHTSVSQYACLQEMGIQLEESMLSLGLRYFSPREIANLHSFPSSLVFPAHISERQQYAMLGNSLSVQVVVELLQYLASIPTSALPVLTSQERNI